MKKSIVFILTFLVMIAITPFIFSKLMNAKFNQMIENIKKVGYKIEEIEDKSSYLTTDRVFKVIIPGEKININYIKDIVLEVESKFKNLPATNVEFFGKVLRINLINGDDKKLNEFIKDKIKFLVITPNFKTFKYKIFKTNLVDNNFEIKTSDISGIYQKPSKNTTSFNDLQLILNKVKFEIKNFKNDYEKEENIVRTNSKFNFYILAKKNNILFNNINSNSVIYFGNKIKENENITVSNIKIFNKLILEDTKLKFNADNIDAKIVEKIKNEKDKMKKEELIKKLIEKGFDINANLDIKNIKFENRKLGIFKLNINLKIKPDNNIFEKLSNKNVEDIEAHLHLVTTPEIATLIISAMPQSVVLFSLAKKEKNLIVLDLILKNGKISKNEKIKSN